MQMGLRDGYCTLFVLPMLGTRIWKCFAARSPSPKQLTIASLSSIAFFFYCNITTSGETHITNPLSIQKEAYLDLELDSL